MENTGSLVVRVKRKRGEESAASLYLVEEAPSAKKKSSIRHIERELAQLSASQDEKPTQRILLRKVHTIDATDNVDTATYSSLKRSREVAELEDAPETPASNAIMWVTQGKKAYTDADVGSLLIVDMAQVPMRSEVKSPTKKGVKILDPMTRQLDAAIASSYASGDLSPLREAIERGADINHSCVSCGGISALMVAAYYHNTALASWLIVRGADVLLCDSDARSAIDYVSLQPSSPAACEISQLIRHTIQDKRSEIPDILSDDYVYDIYCIPNSIPASNEAASTSELPTVHVSGLHFDSLGNVEFCYDSDWSDLADDEDPDSNDERFEGNDYPDESDDEAVAIGDTYAEDVDSDEEQMPRFQRRGVGRVLKPFAMHDAQMPTNDRENRLKNLWDLRPGKGDSGSEDEYRDAEEERLENMAHRTGMHVGASHREFDASGLPKYGCDLSDDGDIDWMNSHSIEKSMRDQYWNDTAYDSELDGSDD